MDNRTKEDILQELFLKSRQSSLSFHRMVLTLSVSLLGLVVAFYSNIDKSIFDCILLKYSYILSVLTLSLGILFLAIGLYGYVASDTSLAHNYYKSVIDKNGAFYGKDEYAVQDSTPAFYSVASILGYVLLSCSVIAFASYLVLLVV